MWKNSISLTMFFTTLGGSYRHWRLGHLDPRSIVPVALAGAMATIVFSLVFGFVSGEGRWLDLGMGFVFCLVAGRMIFEGAAGVGQGENPEKHGSKGVDAPVAQKVGVGVAAGVLPGLLGIGTGGILVPAFNLVMKASIRAAIAASLTCFCFNAFISATIKIAQGFTVLEVALPVALGTLLGSNLGAVANGRLSTGIIKIVFGAVFALVAARFLFSSLAG